MSTGTTLIQALDAAWAAIQGSHPEVPAVVIVTGRRRSKSEMTTRGSHCSESWKVAGTEGRLAEVWISGERLADGATAVVNTLIHEAAHALAKAREIEDTSNRGRYHNAKFAALAKEMGLTPPSASAGPTMGYSDCVITDETAALYQAEIEAIEATGACVLQRPDEEEKPKRKPRQFATCGCMDQEGDEPARFPWSRASQKFCDEYGPVQHQACGQYFQPQEEDEDGEAFDAHVTILRKIAA